MSSYLAVKKYSQLFFALSILLLAFTISPLLAQEKLSSEAEIALNDGLDAVSAEKWSEAVDHFKNVIETAAHESGLRAFYNDGLSSEDYYRYRDKSEEEFLSFSNVVPAYVFYNLALASDKYDQTPLSTAMYYRAYLAYDQATDKRRTIEKRISELEKDHLQYIHPLCEAAEPRMRMVSGLSVDGGPKIPADCIMALVAVGETRLANEIEEKYREGYFTDFRDHCSSGNTAYLDVGYAMGYSLIGDDSSFNKYDKRVRASRRYNEPMCKNYQPYIVTYLEDAIELIDELRTSWERQLENKDWIGGYTAQAIDWVVPTIWAKNAPQGASLCDTFSKYSEDPMPNPLEALGAYLKLKNYDPYNKKDVGNATEPNRFSEVIAKHNTCAAKLLAHYWVRYERTLKLWEKRSLELQVAVVAPSLPRQRHDLNAGYEFTDCTECPSMVVVASGSFMMGSPSDEEGRFDTEGPQHSVTIARDFAAGKFEVTFDDWDACVSAGGCNGYRPPSSWGRGTRPVGIVSWNDAIAYASWLSQKTSETYRLLSEAEWEYAARAGTSSPYPWGDKASHEFANYGQDECCDGLASGRDKWADEPAPAGSFPPNAFGLHDMHGNVSEMVEDCFHISYRGAPSDGSAWLDENCDNHTSRGGSFNGAPRFTRSAVRGSAGLDQRNVYARGFRVARDLD